jgi:hypothetical protein
MHAWQQRENERLIAKFDADATVDALGVVRWKSNNNVPPNDVLTLWHAANKPFNLALSTQVRTDETAAFLQQYREAALNAPRDPEAEAERAFELRAAFGPGVTVVNAITGEKHTT